MSSREGLDRFLKGFVIGAAAVVAAPALAVVGEVDGVLAGKTVDTIDLQWSAEPDAQAYFLYRAPGGGGAPVFAPLLCTIETFASDADVPPPGGLFQYVVSAADGGGDEGSLGFASSGAERIPSSPGSLNACPRRVVFAGGGIDSSHHDARGFYVIYDGGGVRLRDVSNPAFPPGPPVTNLQIEPKLVAAANDRGLVSLAGECIEETDPEGDGTTDLLPDAWFFVYGPDAQLLAWTGPATSPGSFKNLTGLAGYLPPATDTDVGGGLVAIGGAGTDPVTLARTGWWALYDSGAALVRSHAGTPGPGTHNEPEPFVPITPFEVYDVAAGGGLAAFVGQRPIVVDATGVEMPEGAFVVYDGSGAVVVTEGNLASLYPFLPAARRVAVGGGLVAICGDGYLPGGAARSAWYALFDDTGTLLATDQGTGVAFEKCDDVAANAGLAVFGLTRATVVASLPQPEGAFYVHDATGAVVASSVGFKADSGYTHLPIVTDVDADAGFVAIGGGHSDPVSRLPMGFFVLYDSNGVILRHSKAPGIPPSDPGYPAYDVAFPPEIFSVDVELQRAIVGGRNRIALGNDCGAGTCPIPEGFFLVYEIPSGNLVVSSGAYKASAGFAVLPPVTDVDAEGQRAAVGGEHLDPATNLPTGFFALFDRTGTVVRDSTAPGMSLSLAPQIRAVDIDGGLFAVGGAGRAVLSPGGSAYPVPEGWFALYRATDGALLDWSGPYSTFYNGVPNVPPKVPDPFTILPPVSSVDAESSAGDGIDPQQWVDGEVYTRLSTEARTAVVGGRLNQPEMVAKGDFFVVYDEGGGLVVDGYQPQFTGLTLPEGVSDHGVALSHTVVDTDRGYTVLGGVRQTDLVTGEIEGFFVVYDPFGRVVTHWREFNAKRGIVKLPNVRTVDVDDDRIVVGGFHDPTGFNPEGFFAMYDLRGNLVVDSFDPGLVPPTPAYPGITVADTDAGWTVVVGDYPSGADPALFWSAYDRWGRLVASSNGFNGGNPVFAEARDADVEAHGSRIRIAVAGRGFVPPAGPFTPTVRSVVVLHHCDGTILSQLVADGKRAVDVDLDSGAFLTAVDHEGFDAFGVSVFHPDYRIANLCGVTCASAADVPHLATYRDLGTDDADVDAGRAVLGGTGTHEYSTVCPGGGDPVPIQNLVGYYAIYDVSSVGADPPICPLLLASPAPSPTVFPPRVLKVDTENELTVMCGEQGWGQFPNCDATGRERFWGLYAATPAEPPVVGTGIPGPPVVGFPDPTVGACDLDHDRAVFAGAPIFGPAPPPTAFARLYDWSGTLIGDIAADLPATVSGHLFSRADVEEHAAVVWGSRIYRVVRAKPTAAPNFRQADDDEYAFWRPVLAAPDPFDPDGRPFVIECADTDEVGDNHGGIPTTPVVDEDE